MRRDAQVLSAKKCAICKGSFVRGHRTKEQWAVAKFCSVACSIKSKEGVARPDLIASFAKIRKRHIGETHWNWKGGISDSEKALRNTPRYHAWRKAVYQRDNWTCQVCKVKQKHPIAHHIKFFSDYPELRYDVDNGMTLCRSCHKHIHANIGMTTRFNSRPA